MNVYHCWYYQSLGWGAYMEHESIIVANTETEALGMALDDAPDTVAAHWEISRIDTSTTGVKHSVDKSP